MIKRGLQSPRSSSPKVIHLDAILDQVGLVGEHHSLAGPGPLIKQKKQLHTVEPKRKDKTTPGEGAPVNIYLHPYILLGG